VLQFFAVSDYSKARYLFEDGKATRLEIRVRRVGWGGHEGLDDDDDTVYPKRQPKHREPEINKQEWIERSALPAGLCKIRGSMAVASAEKCEEMCNPVMLTIPGRHLQAVRGKR
jgi:hypothetical protein